MKIKQMGDEKEEAKEKNDFLSTLRKNDKPEIKDKMLSEGDRTEKHFDVVIQKDYGSSRTDKVIENNEGYSYQSQKDGFFNEFIMDLKYNHSVFNVVFNYSLAYPIWIRIIILSFSTTLDLLVIACYFTDKRINKRTMYAKEHGYDSVGYLYSWRNETHVAVLSSLISMGIFFVLSILIHISSKSKLELFNSLKTRNQTVIEKQVYYFLF